MLNQAGNWRRSGFRWAITILVLILALSHVPVSPATAQTPDVTDPADLETFLNGVMADHYEDYDLAGAVVAVVHDGETLFSQGYGHADVEQDIPVDPATTLFRIGSVTKLFTFTAVMQLVEQGELDLYTDVNTYLTDFQVPDTYPEPITMDHLMGHTAGFEDRLVGLFARGPDELRPLGDTLAEELPSRIRPPGEVSAYSNHGVALAGYVVEQVSGMSWEEYVEQNILLPLGMERTTSRQPVPDDLDADMAEGYAFSNGQPDPQGFEYVTVPPAGSISATAEDMANFMIAHLQHGQFNDTRMLDEATARQMHSQNFSHDPRVNGFAHGFIEREYNEQRVIGHGGATVLFVTDLLLLPEENLGLFVSYNTREGGANAGSELVQAFMDRYYPDPETTLPDPEPGVEERIDEVSGAYRPVQLESTTVDKAVGLFQMFDVSAEDDGILHVQAAASEGRFVEVSPYVFEEVEGDGMLGTLVFNENDEGRPDELYVGNMPESALERIAWYETTTFSLALVGASLLLFLSAVLIWPVQALRNRNSNQSGNRGATIARWASWTASTLFLAFAISLVVALSDPNEIAFGVPPLAQLGLASALGAAVLTIPAVALTVLAWLLGYWGAVGRIHYTLVTVAALAMVWWLNYWNLLGFQY